jgi:transposase
MPKRNGAVHVATTKRNYKGKTYCTHLLRRTYRKDGKVHHETLGNISHLPEDLIELIRQRLRGENPAPLGSFDIIRSLPHGHVALVLGELKELGLDQLIASRRCRERDLVVAMIVARVLFPGSKLACCRGLREETAVSSLAFELELGQFEDREIYESLDWLLKRQNRIETKLAKRHLKEGNLLLYDLSGSYYTGKRSALILFGHNRDGKRGVPQIVYGLLCEDQGCPISIEVFPGNTADPNTLSNQIAKVRKRFGIDRVTFVGDRGMITSKRIEAEFRGVEGLDWISALRSDSIKKLATQGSIPDSLFDEKNLAEISSPDFPGERLIVCRNPLLADERARKRRELLDAAEKQLQAISAATQREKRPLRGKVAIGLKVGRKLNQYKMAKHFILDIKDDSFTCQRNEEKIAAEAALDGIYVIRTSVDEESLKAEDTVRAYKDLAKVERAFRSLKTIDLKIRPIHHWLDERIRAHVFLCMLAYYVEWHLRKKLAPILFDDEERERAEAQRASIVDPSPRSKTARRKDADKRTEDGWAVHSFQTLLKDLSTLALNQVRVASGDDKEKGSFLIKTKPTPFQKHVFGLVSITP